MFEHFHKPGIHLHPFSLRTVHRCPLHIIEGASLEKNKELDTELGVTAILGSGPGLGIYFVIVSVLALINCLLDTN